MPQQTDSIEACLQERADAELVALCFIHVCLVKSGKLAASGISFYAATQMSSYCAK